MKACIHFVLILIIICWNLIAFAKKDIKQIFVMDDKGNGVKSDIFLDKNHKGYTDNDGQFKLNDKCKETKQVIAKPDNKFFFNGKENCIFNKNPIAVVVTKKEYYENLIYNANELEKKNDYAALALVYAEIAERSVKIMDQLTPDEKEIAQKAKEKSIIYAAMYFDLNTSNQKVVYYDPDQEKKVIGSEFAEKIGKYQLSKNLKVTNELNYHTLSEAANININSYLFYRIPSENNILPVFQAIGAININTMKAAKAGKEEVEASQRSIKSRSINIRK